LEAAVLAKLYDVRVAEFATNDYNTDWRVYVHNPEGRNILLPIVNHVSYWGCLEYDPDCEENIWATKNMGKLVRPQTEEVDEPKTASSDHSNPASSPTYSNDEDFDEIERKANAKAEKEEQIRKERGDGYRLKTSLPARSKPLKLESTGKCI
jgi:hypothetical protein